MKYEHGTHAAYVLDRCRCTSCKVATREYERERAQRIEPAYVAAGPAREHVRLLSQAGVGLKTIAKLSGVPHGTLSKLMYGDRARGMSPSKRVRKTTLDRILSVWPNNVANGAKIDATRTWVLLDEMIDAGVPRARIAQQLGARSPALQLSRQQVEAGTARKVERLHADWKAGRVVLSRGHRHRPPAPVVAPAPVPVTVRTAADADQEARSRADISDLFLELAEIVELRNSQPWRAQAACRTRPTWLWFPARGDHRTLDKALRICRACIVRDRCRAEMFTERVGVYGGLAAGARRTIVRLDKEPAA